jgi:hypothetical protein
LIDSEALILASIYLIVEIKFPVQSGLDLEGRRKKSPRFMQINGQCQGYSLPNPRKIPVLIPDNREFTPENVSLETASIAFITNKMRENVTTKLAFSLSHFGSATGEKASESMRVS